METDSSDTPRTVTITAIKDDAGKRTVAENLSRITSGQPPVERILARLDTLPWTVTRKASVKSARKLVSLLQNLGASVEISPPIPPDTIVGTVEPPATASPITPPPAAKYENEVVTPKATVDHQAFPLKEKIIRSEKNETADSGEFILEPLSLGGILDRTFQICRAHFWKLLVIAGIPILLIGGIALVVALIVLVGRIDMAGSRRFTAMDNNRGSYIDYSVSNCHSHRNILLVPGGHDSCSVFHLFGAQDNR